MDWIVVALVALLALMHLAYAVQNLLNLASAHGAVRAVLGQEERPVYARSFVPVVRSPLLTGLALATIVMLQFAAGAALAAGSFALSTGGAGDWAELGCGLALLLWFGLFLGVGAPLLQMWQTPLGQGAMGDAARNGLFAFAMLVLLQLSPL